MSKGFLDIFSTLKIDGKTKAVMSDVVVDKIIKNTSASLIKIHVNASRPVEPEIIYSLEKSIETQIFSGEKFEVTIQGIKAPEIEESLSEGTLWKDDFAMAEAMENQNNNISKKKPQKSKKTQGKSNPKDYGENILYGKPVKEEQFVSMSDLVPDLKDVVLLCHVFKIDSKPLKNEKILLTLYLTDDTDSICGKLFLDPDTGNELEGKLKENPFIKIKGSISLDKFDNELSLVQIRGIEIARDFREVRIDDYDVKRVELHLHTAMSDQDGTIDVKRLINRAKLWGHSAMAITDNGNVQAFPEVAKFAKDDIKILYGMQGYLCDDIKPIANIKTGDEAYRLDGEMVIFDLETTGLNASKESIIEIGAVKVKDGEITDSFSAFVNPKKPLSYEIIELTGIDDSMLIDEPEIDTVLRDFREFCKDLPLVAHNADFDISCIRANAKRLNIQWEMSYIDTVPLSRILLPGLFKTKLDNVAKALNINLLNHHRAIDDATCTGEIYNKFIGMLAHQDIHTLGELNTKLTKDEKFVGKLFPYQCSIIAKNDIGRINLYKLVSVSHLKYFRQIPRIPKSELIKHKEGLLLGSGTGRGELFDSLLSGKNDSEIRRVVQFYDYLEVMPAENSSLLALEHRYGINSLEDINKINARIVRLGEEYNKPVVAVSDAHYLDKHEEIYRRIILSERKIPIKKTEPNLYLRTTEEMLEAFMFLGEKKAREIVVKNTNMIAKQCDRIYPTRPDKCPPVIEHSDTMLRNICQRKAEQMYGKNLPDILKERLDRELNSIINNGYALMYIIAQKLVWKSNEDGYLVGSRGSVGSSLVATLAGISEVNPLPPHYLCDQCHYVDFDSDLVKEQAGKAGCDMPDRLCPKCGSPLGKHGFDIPFETFLGFKGNKEPDIDLNFSGEYLNKAHKYTEVIFGEGQTFRAGTVGTIQENTAYAYTKSYFEKHNIIKRKCETERISMGCTGVKRTTGQHPGGIIVLPVGEEMESFTPIQHPANDMETDIVTTHFDFHSIDSNLLKLDILGKDDPTQIRLLEEITGVDVLKIPLDDKKVLSLFQNTEALNLTPSDIMGCDFGTLGIPEFGTDFAMGILRDTKPETIMDLVRIAGLSHGTDVWNGNAKELIAEGKANIGTAICTRDDIMLYLISEGLPKEESFNIMESVRKGKGLTPEWKQDMINVGIPDWYIWSCETIKYMFPKAHAAAYVMMAYRIGYFKVYYPLAFYAAYFSIKSTAFSYKMMCQGPEVLSHYIEEYNKIQNPKAKEKDIIRDMRIVQEMYARGFDFMPVDLYKSEALKFKPVGKKSLLPPFSAIEGMGVLAAQSLEIAAKAAKFTSKDDIRERGKVTKNILESMEEMGLLRGFSKSNQLSLFDMIESERH